MKKLKWKEIKNFVSLNKKASVWVRHCHPPEDYLLRITSSFGIHKVDMQLDTSKEDQLRAKYDFKYPR